MRSYENVNRVIYLELPKHERLIYDRYRVRRAAKETIEDFEKAQRLLEVFGVNRTSLAQLRRARRRLRGLTRFHWKLVQTEKSYRAWQSLNVALTNAEIEGILAVDRFRAACRTFNEQRLVTKY